MSKKNCTLSCNFNLKKRNLFLFSVLSFLMFSTPTFSQSKTVTGTVQNEKGDPLPEVSVSVKNSKTGTITSSDGRFSIKVPQGKTTLIFSSTGYEAREFLVNGTSLNVQLIYKPTEMGEVVVVAYGGTQKKATMSGAIATVRGEEILKSPAINVSNSLAGRVAGLTVVGQGGEPGNDFSTILVRGINTFKNATPLFVVDGVPLQGSDKLQRIDPSSIESITVLKDASAAIYGSQGANGVILVTTKRGKSGKVSVSATFNQGYSQPTKLPNLLNSYEIAVLQNEGLDSDPNFPTPPWHTQKYTAAELEGFKNNNDPWHYGNTDWIKETLKNWAPQRYANVTVSGGSDKIRGLMSLASRYQDGFFKNGSGNYNQYDLRGNVDMNPSKYILFSVDINGRYDKPDYPTSNSGRIFNQMISASPTVRAYWPNGAIGQSVDPGGQSGSPVAISTPLGGYNKSENYVFNSTARLNIKTPWVDGLSFTFTGTFDRVFNYGKVWTIPVTYNEAWDGVSTTDPVFTTKVQGDLARTLTESQGRSKNYLVNALVNYEKKIGDHTIKFLGGYEEYERYSSFYSLTRKNFDANDLDQIRFGRQGTEAIEQNSPGATRWRNYLGRVNYDFKSKLLAEFVFRYQGSSIFRKEDRWGFFPGGSIAYRISEENFWKNNLSFINSFKFRASYGVTGNDLVAPFQYLALFKTGDNPNYVEQVGPGGALTHTSTLQESVVPNPGVTWETGKQLDLGFDAEFLKGKLSVTADYFRNKRTDILAQRSGGIPASTGITPADENIGTFLNRGFDFNISYKNSGRKLKYQIGLNGLYAKNKILFFDEVAGRPDYQQQTGHPIGSGSYYHVLGIFHTAEDLAKHPVGLGGVKPVLGDLIFEDKNNDGAINNKDKVKSDKSNTPVFSGGLSTNFQYQNFDLSILFQGAFGAERYLRPRFSLGGNYLQAFYDERWTPSNPNSKFPRVHSAGSAYWSNPDGIANTFFVRKTDFVRLKNIELGYSLPKAMLQKLNIENIRISISALNLLTIAPDLKDFDTDPEEIVREQFYGESYPLQRIFNFGINVSF